MTADITLACPNQVIPFFHLESCVPSRTEDSGMSFRTQALGIHVDRNKTKKLEELLKKTYNGKGQKSMFVAWSFKQQQKDAFRDAMIAQGTYLTSVWVVPVHGISIDQMKGIRPLLLATTSVNSVEQMKRTKDSGRWNVLVNKLHFKTAKEAIRVVLDQFETTAPTANTKLPPGWTKWSDKLIKNEEDSVGEQSFLTMSAHSFASLVTDADRENESIKNGVEFDMSIITDQPKKHPTHQQTESSNNEVSHEILLLRAQLKKQEEVIKRMEDKMIQMAKQTPIQQEALHVEEETVIGADNMDTEDTSKPPSRIDKIEMKFDRLIDAFSNFQSHQEQQFRAFLQENNKRTKDDTSTAASSLGHASKKTDNKTTPTKPARSPSFAEAMESQP
jgi:hypothetical protein